MHMMKERPKWFDLDHLGFWNEGYFSYLVSLLLVFSLDCLEE